MSLPPEATLAPRVNIQAITDVGRVRAHNEDNFIVCPNLCEKEWYLSDHPVTLSAKGCLLVVADGMGGTNAGEVASAIAVDTIKDSFDSLALEENIAEDEIERYLNEAILEANQAIAMASQQNPSQAGMGTTVVLAWVFQHKAFIAWVGDSRAYLHSERHGLELLTADHSLVWELVEAGKLTPDEADIHPQSNIITQSLGNSQRLPRPGFTSCSLQPGDRLMLCSDGLNNMVTHKNIEKIIGAGTPLAAACKKLIKAANDAGGADNITVLALEVMGKPPKRQRFRLFGIF